MLFNSYIFLAFLPITWAVYFLFNHFNKFRIAQVTLIVASFVFYGYGNYRLCLLLAFSITVNYLLHLGMMRERSSDGFRRFFLILGILINLGLLFYFKYFDFTLQNLNRFFGTDFVMRNIALPLGISFYTFQQISFIVDSYQRKMEKYGFLDYSLFVSFFPQLIAGPIVLHQEIIPQFQNPEKRKVNYDNLLSGAEYFIMGFAKKVLLADSFARICDAGYENLSALNSLSAVCTILTFTLEIYFDFSGYCDMALGIGRFFNIYIPVNFNSPYKALNISDFWKRWHMTLTRFLTTYIYIPLGGSRRGMVRTYVNIMIVFTLSGLWHGADWTFVLWGMLHGVAMVIYRVGKKAFDRLPAWFMWLCTFLFVNAAWVFFRADFFMQPWHLFGRVLNGGTGGIHPAMLAALCDNTIWKLTLERVVGSSALQYICQAVTALGVGLGVFICVKLPSAHELVEKRNRSTGWFVFLSILFVWSFTWLSQVSKFIYFNF